MWGKQGKSQSYLCWDKLDNQDKVGLLNFLDKQDMSHEPLWYTLDIQDKRDMSNFQEMEDRLSE